MTIGYLIRRNLAHYWRTNLAVVAGVAVTVAVLAGALLVGDSVRASLRELFLARLGKTSHVITAENFFREQLAADMADAAHAGAKADQFAVPMIVLEGVVTHEKSGRRASSVAVYGVDERFWKFHVQDTGATPHNREILLSPALAKEFAAAPGDSILIRVQKPSDIPVESLHGRKDDLGRSIRLTLRDTLLAAQMGEFSIHPQQGAVRAVFVPLRRVQQDLKQDGRVNTILLADDTEQAGKDRPVQGPAPADLLRRAFSLADLGLRVTSLPDGEYSVESDKVLLDDHIADAVRSVAAAKQMHTTPLFTYLATSIRIGAREIPYSLVTATDEAALSGKHDAVPSGATLPPIWLNSWAAADLGARPGNTVTLDYYVWDESNRLVTQSTKFMFLGAVPLRGAAADPLLAPQFPGITDSPDISDWDPSFPVDLKRVRPRDEAYWKQYRTIPKAFIPLEVGQKLWGSRFGKLTAIRIHPLLKGGAAEGPAGREQFERDLRSALDPVQAGLAVLPVRAEGAQASYGAVNFSEYFIYFSFFLVVSAVLLAGLFFKLGIEQRVREIGLLQAVGFPREKVAALFLSEGAVLSALGTLAGLAGAVLYGAVMMYGLRTWWAGAVGTTLLRLHVVPASLALGGVAGILAALLCIVWTLRGLRRSSALNLLVGARDTTSLDGTQRSPRTVLFLAMGCAVSGMALLAGAASGRVGQVGGFFGSGTLLLAALVCFAWVWLASRRHRLMAGTGFAGLSRMGFRNAMWRPGRSLLCIALIASATFIIVAVEAFRRDPAATSSDRHSGAGGYPLLAESLLPLPYDPNTPEGRLSLNLTDREISALEGITLTSFRVRPGDDVSCLNLYQPRNPKILAAPASFLREGRFAFQESLTQTPEERQNPWSLLEREQSGGAIPAILDANSMTYVLHLKLGDELVVNAGTPQPVRLRIVAALADSIFQGEMLISEKNFLRAFPHAQGFRYFLVDPPLQRAADVAATLEQGLSDYGFDAVPAAERLATFHRVENTYLSTFQALGGLGLVLGTFGLAAVLLRNVLERRRELALLRAVGYRPADLGFLVVAENALLLAFGLAAGLVSALLAIAPALAARGGSRPALSMAVLLGAVLLTGLAASLAAVAAVVRAPLLSALRSE